MICLRFGVYGLGFRVLLIEKNMADFPFSTQFSLLYFNVSELSFVRMTINEIPGQFGWFTVPNRGEVQ